MSMDAPRRLLLLCRDRNGRITKSSPHLETMYNGLEYYVVEVTCDDGSQYGIQVYGEEAIALYNEVTKILQ